jgi:hypothetical protein
MLLGEEVYVLGLFQASSSMWIPLSRPATLAEIDLPLRLNGLGTHYGESWPRQRSSNHGTECAPAHAPSIHAG